MRCKKILIITTIAVLIYASAAFGNTANLNGTSYSISFHGTNVNVWDTIVTFKFTTYDGDLYGRPLHDGDYGPNMIVSHELKKDGNLYKTDFVVIEYGYVSDTGELHLDLASPDINDNGIDDVCEKSMSFNGSISGTWCHDGGTVDESSGTLTRNANSHHGAYQITLPFAYMVLTLIGDFYVGTISGIINYSEKEKTFSITYTSKFKYQSSPVTLETTYEILDQDRIKVNAKGIFPSTVFTRNGNTYSAVVELTDGDSYTSWPDYQKWLLLIEDTNDFDGDGIPDLSDPAQSKAIPAIPSLLLNE
jgi:hypothetical protein